MDKGLKNGSIVGRVWSGVGLAMLLAAAAGGVLWSDVASTRDSAAVLNQRLVPAMKTVLGVMADVRQARLLETQLLVARSDEQRRRHEAEITQQRQLLDARLQNYRALDALDRQHSDAVTHGLLGYWSAQDQVMAALHRAQEGSATQDLPYQLAQGVSLQAYDALSAAADGWRLHSEHLAQAQAQRATATPPWRIALAGLLFVLACGVAIATVRRLSERIRGPLAQAVRALRHAASGHADYRLKITRLDEFGGLLVAIDNLRETLVLAFSSAEDDEPQPVMAVSALPKRAVMKASEAVLRGGEPAGRPAVAHTVVQGVAPAGSSPLPA